MKVQARMEDKVRIKNLKSLFEFFEKFSWVLVENPSTVVYGPSWCQIHPHSGFCYLHGPRAKPIRVQGLCVGGEL